MGECGRTGSQRRHGWHSLKLHRRMVGGDAADAAAVGKGRYLGVVHVGHALVYAAEETPHRLQELGSRRRAGNKRREKEGKKHDAKSVSGPVCAHRRARGKSRRPPPQKAAESSASGGCERRALSTFELAARWLLALPCGLALRLHSRVSMRCCACVLLRGVPGFSVAVWVGRGDARIFL